MNQSKKLILLGVLLCVVIALMALALFKFLPKNLLSIITPTTELTIDAQIVNSFNKNDMVSVIASADAQLASNPKDTDFLLIKASALAQEGSLTFKETQYGQQSIAIAQQVLNINSNSDEAWRTIGYANEIQQNYTEAHVAYAKAIAINPNNAPAIFGDAHAWDLQGDMVKAEKGYRASLAINKYLDIAHIGMGRVLVAKNSMNEALLEFTGIASTSQNARIRAEADYSAGSIQLGYGNLKEAEYYGRKATIDDPSYSLGWVGLGAALQAKSVQKGELPNSARLDFVNESTIALSKAIQLNPNQSLAHYYSALAVLSVGGKEEAKSILTQAKSSVPIDITLSATDKQKVLSQIASTLKIINDMPSKQ